MKRPIEAHTLVERSSEPVAAEVDRSVVMMSLAQGMYYGLEGSGPRIWALLERPTTVEDVCRALTREFDIDPEVCFQDVRAFLEELHEAKLIEIRDDAAAPRP
jgi:hypothetical protein